LLHNVRGFSRHQKLDILIILRGQQV